MTVFLRRMLPCALMLSLAAFGAMAAITTLGVGFYMKYDNRKRNKAQGVSLKARDVPTSKLKPPYQKVSPLLSRKSPQNVDDARTPCGGGWASGNKHPCWIWWERARRVESWSIKSLSHFSIQNIPES